MKVTQQHLIAYLSFLLLSISSQVSGQPRTAEPEVPQKEDYVNYSFDFSAHTRPIAYVTHGNALELNNKVKVNPAVANRGGAYVFDSTISDKDFEIEVEFTIQSPLDQARGFMLLLTQQEMLEQEFEESTIGYRQNYEGAGVYVFRHPHKDNKWYAMLL